MSGMLINLIIQIVSGAIGGNVAGGAAKNIDLGTLGNTIAGAIGGGAGGQLLGMLIPLLPIAPRHPISAASSARSPVAASPVPFSPRSSAPSKTGRPERSATKCLHNWQRTSAEIAFVRQGPRLYKPVASSHDLKRLL